MSNLTTTFARAVAALVSYQGVWLAGSASPTNMIAGRVVTMPELVCAADSPRWLAERRKGITATDITAILGLVPYDSPYSLYWRKTGDLPEMEDNDRLRLGRELEPYVEGRWGEANPDACYDLIPSLWRSTARPWQMATPDAAVYDGEAKPTTWEIEIEPAATVAVLEVKTWADAGKPAWGDTGTADVPVRVRAQVLWQMDVMDVAAGHVGVVFLPSGEFRHYTIEHDRTNGCRFGLQDPCPIEVICPACCDLCMMRDAGLEFYRRMTGELPPPDLDGSVATLAALKGRYPDARKGKTVPIPADLWDAYESAKFDKGLAEGAIREAEAQIRELTGEAADLEVDGQVVGRHVIFDQHIREHTRRMDFIKRIGSKTDE